VPAAEFSPDATQLASTGKDRTLRLWELTAPYRARVLGPLPAAGQALAYHPEGRLLACADYATGRISLWSPQTGLALGEVGADPPHLGAVWACDISRDGDYLAAVGGGLRVWKLGRPPADEDRAPWPVEPLLSEPAAEANVVFHPSGEYLAYVAILASADRFVTGIHLRDLSPDARPWLVTSNSQASIIQIQGFLPRSGALFYVNREREIVIVDPTTRAIVRRFPTLSPGQMPSTYLGNVRVSPDESKLAMVSLTGLGVDVWEVAAGRLLYSLPDHPGSIWWLAWSPDSRRVAVSRANGAIAIWDTSSVEAQLAELGLE
jgi:WD40 repeat protein